MTVPQAKHSHNHEITELSSYAKFVARKVNRLIPGRRASSDHIHDLMIYISIWIGIAALGGVLLIILIFLYLFFGENRPPLNLAFLSGYFGLYMAAIGFMVKTVGTTIDSATKRLGFADMFVADILAICNVIDQFDLWKRFETLYGELDYVGIDASQYQARTENYFDLWQKHSHEIGALDQKSIKRITRFYTYLKASRDATLELRYWNKDTPISTKQRCVKNILITLALSMKNARLSLTSLVDKNELEQENGYSYVKKQNGIATRVLINVGVDCRTINNLGLAFDEDGEEITLHTPE